MGFWLQLGLSGFRVDAVPFLLETEGGDGDRRSRTRTLPERCASWSAAAPATASCSARSTCRTRGSSSSSAAGRRRADDAVRLHRHAGAVPRDGPRGRGPADRRADRAAGPVAGLAVGHVRAQPRRAHPRQALGLRAAGGVRRLRSGGDDAGLRARPAPSAAADAGRRPAADPDGLQPALLPAGDARCSSTGRRSAWGRISTPRAGSPSARPCSGRSGRNGGFSTAQPRSCRGRS